MACHLCEVPGRAVPVKVLEPLCAGYSDSHEGVALHKCRACGRLFVRYWVEVYEDIHRYYVPISEREADYFRGDRASQLPENDVRSAAIKLISSRQHLRQFPGGKMASWFDGMPPLTGPSGCWG